MKTLIAAGLLTLVPALSLAQSRPSDDCTAQLQRNPRELTIIDVELEPDCLFLIDGCGWRGPHDDLFRPRRSFVDMILRSVEGL